MLKRLVVLLGPNLCTERKTMLMVQIRTAMAISSLALIGTSNLVVHVLNVIMLTFVEHAARTTSSSSVQNTKPTGNSSPHPRGDPRHLTDGSIDQIYVDAFNQKLYDGPFEQAMSMQEFDNFLIEMQQNG